MSIIVLRPPSAKFFDLTEERTTEVVFERLRVHDLPGVRTLVCESERTLLRFISRVQD